MQRLPVAILLLSLLKVSVCVQVIVPQQERSATLLHSVILQCNYFTSANIHDVLVTWRFKSFCREREDNSTLYQDPLNDCTDRQQTVHIVIQRIGTKEPTLGLHYRNRNITLQNKADLVINGVMWSDSGVYYCSVSAAGDVTGDCDKEVKLFVNSFSWNTAERRPTL